VIALDRTVKSKLRSLLFGSLSVLTITIAIGDRIMVAKFASTVGVISRSALDDAAGWTQHRSELLSSASWCFYLAGFAMMCALGSLLALAKWRQPIWPPAKKEICLVWQVTLGFALTLPLVGLWAFFRAVHSMDFVVASHGISDPRATANAIVGAITAANFGLLGAIVSIAVTVWLLKHQAPLPPPLPASVL
jgi:hypothetical protein